MNMVTIVVFILLAILAGAFWVLTKFFHEFEHSFEYLAWGLVIFIIGSAVYLTFAMPTFANPRSSNGTFVAPEANIKLLNK